MEPKVQFVTSMRNNESSRIESEEELSRNNV